MTSEVTAAMERLLLLLLLNVFMSDKNEILIDYAHEHLVGLSGPAP